MSSIFAIGTKHFRLICGLYVHPYAEHNWKETVYTIVLYMYAYMWKDPRHPLHFFLPVASYCCLGRFDYSNTLSAGWVHDNH